MKRGDAELMRAVAEKLRSFLLESTHPCIVTDFLAPDVVLVPAPRSAPLAGKDALWPARALCEALVRGGLGERVLPCLTRTQAVPKSAFAGLGDRPTPLQHYETLNVVRDLLDEPARITIVDDVVTKGATLLAAASRMHDAFPKADVRTFALVRTMGLVPEIEKIGMPCSGRISFDGHGVDRQP